MFHSLFILLDDFWIYKENSWFVGDNRWSGSCHLLFSCLVSWSNMLFSFHSLKLSKHIPLLLHSWKPAMHASSLAYLSCTSYMVFWLSVITCYGDELWPKICVCTMHIDNSRASLNRMISSCEILMYGQCDNVCITEIKWLLLQMLEGQEIRVNKAWNGWNWQYLGHGAATGEGGVVIWFLFNLV